MSGTQRRALPLDSELSGSWISTPSAELLRKYQAVFSDRTNNLWVGHVDFQTGAFLPPDGHGTLVATNATAATDYGNGPEWMLSNGDSRFVYTQCQAPCDPPNDATASLGLATQVGGVWTTTTLPNSVARASPSATLDLGDADPRFNYVDTAKTAWYMRKASALGVEIQLPLSSLSNGNARRWVPEGARSCSRATTRTIRTYICDTNSGERAAHLPSPAPEFKSE